MCTFDTTSVAINYARFASYIHVLLHLDCFATVSIFAVDE